MAKRSRPHPASKRGNPVARSQRAAPYAIRDAPGVVNIHSAARASQPGRRTAVMR